MSLAEDRALLARAQKNAAGFGELYDTFYDRIYAYAFRRVGTREQAEDIAAAVFEDALKGIRRVRWQNRPLAAYLYRIAARRAVDFYRELNRPQHFQEQEPGEQSADENLTRSERHAAVRSAIVRLSENDRELIRLAYFDELDRSEIAGMLSTTPNSVYVRIHRALKRLEKLIDD